MNQITYAVTPDGHTISRIGSEVATGVLDYEAMVPENGYNAGYYFEKFSVHCISSNEWDSWYWTKKIPLPVKNMHRKFWGLPELKDENPVPRWYLCFSEVLCCPDEPDYTAPSDLREILERFGCDRIRRAHPWGNKSIGISWVFDMPSSKYQELEDAIAQTGYSYLTPKVIRWEV